MISNTNNLIDQNGKIKFTNNTKAANIVITGDVCPIFRLESYLADGNLSAVFSDTLEIFQKSDLNIVNLEAVLCGDIAPIEKLGPNLKVHPKIAKVLKSIPVQIACLANNHILDYHEAGLKQTIHSLEEANIKHVGAGRNLEDAEAPLFYEINGVNLCLLNFVIAGAPVNFENAKTAMLEPRHNCQAIKKAVDEGALVIPIIHTGKEQVLLPPPSLRDTCKNFIDAGASAVICHHPHVPQGIEVYQNKPIAYSLGNLLFDWDYPEPETDSSFFIDLGLDENGVVDLKVHPFSKVTEYGGIGLLKGESYLEYIDLLNKLSNPLANPPDYEILWREQCRILYENFYQTKLERGALLGDNKNSKYKMAISTFHNFFAHKTHSDALSEIMKLLSNDNIASDPNANNWLTTHMTKLENFSITKKGIKS